MGRKNKNASPRESAALNVRGVRVRFNRLPSVSLDTAGMAPWQHAVAISAALWCRARYSTSISVTDDPYGVWRACRFIVRGDEGIRPDFTHGVVPRIVSEMREAVREIAHARGFSEEMIRSAVSEVGPIPFVLASLWALVGQIVGSFNQIRQEMLLQIGSIRPVWMVDYKTQHLHQRDLHAPFVLVEQGLTPVGDTGSILFADPGVDPHRFAALAGSRHCVGVVAFSRNGLVLGWASNQRCYQVVSDQTALVERLMHESLQIPLSSDGSVTIPPVLVHG